MNATELAKAYALEKTGLNWDRRDKWSDANRTAYLAANAEYRQRNPGLFTPAELAAASNYESAANAKAPEFSYVRATANALGERIEEIGGQVAGVGEGIFSGLSLMRWLIPLAIVAGVAIWLWRFAGSPAPSAFSAHFNRTRRRK